MDESSRSQLDQRVHDSYRDWGWSTEVLGLVLIAFGIGTIPLVLAWTKPLLGSDGMNYAGAIPGAVLIATGIALLAVPLLQVLGRRAVAIAVVAYALLAVLVIAMLCLVPRPPVVRHYTPPVAHHQQPPAV